MPAVTAELTALSQSLAAAGGDKIQYAISGAIRLAAEEIQREAQQNAPRKTGALASSITVSFSGPLTATIGPGVLYGTFQEFGTGTRGEFPGQMYVIKPKKPGGRLVFTINGTKVVTKEVHHPGIPHHPFMRPAAKDVLGHLTTEVAGIGVNVAMEGDLGE